MTVSIVATAFAILAQEVDDNGVEDSVSMTIAPAPKDERGRFTNIEGDLTHGSLGVRLPFFLRRIASSFAKVQGAPRQILNDGAFLRDNVEHSKPTVTWIGHATILVQMAHVTFLTDPIWSNRASPLSFLGPKRTVEPGIRIEDLPAIDFVLISHNHYDHLDLPTLRKLARRNAKTRFLVPLGNAKLLRKHGIEQVEEMDWGDTFTVAGATIHCLPTQHWSKRSATDTNKTLWSSWAVTGAQKKFYFAGDTGYFRGFAEIGSKLGPFDLAAVPIGAFEPRAMMRASHMNPEEAVQAAIDLKAENSVAIHFGTFVLSDEPIREPPLRFKAAAKEQGLNEGSAWVMDIGETREF